MPPKVAVFCLLLFELATTFGAAWLAATVCVHFLGTQTHVASMYDIGIALLGAVTASASTYAAGLYSTEVPKISRLIPRLMAAHVFAFCALVVILFIAGGIKFIPSRSFLTLWMFFSICGVAFWRMTFRLCVNSLMERGLASRRSVIFGTRESIDALDQSFWDYEADAIVSYHLAEAADPEDVKRKALDLIKLGRHGGYSKIILITRIEDQTLFLRSIRRLAALPVDIIVIPIMPELQKLEASKFKFIEFRGLSAIEVQRAPLSARQRLLKNAFDRVLSGIALLLLSPVFLVIAAAIAIDSRGPIFFRQRRTGYNNEIFRIWKFRTMTVLEDGPDVVQAIRNDSRVTRVGKFLRSSSLDELPQLINVLAGDMSLVGPRPHALIHDEIYAKMLDDYEIRHRVKPGITGLAQVNGYRGETKDPHQLMMRSQLDNEYTRNWSLLGDIKILIRTLGVWATQNNAY